MNRRDLKELLKEEKWNLIKEKQLEIEEADIAILLEELPINETIKIFRFLPKDLAASVFKFFPSDIKKEIITSISQIEAANIIEKLYSDDATDLIEEMPANVVKKILANTTPETRYTINMLLQYPEDSAGSIMSIDFIDLKEDLTVEEAITKIRKEEIDKEYIEYCYVLGPERELVGTVTLRRLLISQPNEKISQIMKKGPISIYTMQDQEEVALLFKKYDFKMMPVVDSEQRLVGVITVDDIVDIMEKETTEDMEKMAAIVPDDKPYMKSSVISIFKKRIPWLLILMISATFTSGIITHYESALANYVILTAFIPMFMDTAGNAGSQTSVTIIRGISLNEIKFKDLFKVLWKEFRVATLVGIVLGIANFIKLILLNHVSLEIATIVCSTLFFTIIFAKILGGSLPLLAKKLGFDPAVMASPLITTIVDAASLIIYFNIASWLLPL